MILLLTSVLGLIGALGVGLLFASLRSVHRIARVEDRGSWWASRKTLTSKGYVLNRLGFSISMVALLGLLIMVGLMAAGSFAAA